MKITQIEVSYAETVSYGQFANAKIGRKYVAELPDDQFQPEDRELVEGLLISDAIAAVRNDIDNVLEENGEQPKYHEGTRYYIHLSRIARIVLVSAVNLKLPEEYEFNFYFGRLYGGKYTAPMRKTTQIHKATELANKEGFTVFIADDQESFKGLPELPEAKYETVTINHQTETVSDPPLDPKYQELEY